MWHYPKQPSCAVATPRLGGAVRGYGCLLWSAAALLWQTEGPPSPSRWKPPPVTVVSLNGGVARARPRKAASPDGLDRRPPESGPTTPLGSGGRSAGHFPYLAARSAAARGPSVGFGGLRPPQLGSLQLWGVPSLGLACLRMQALPSGYTPPPSYGRDAWPHLPATWRLPSMTPGYP